MNEDRLAEVRKQHSVFVNSYGQETCSWCLYPWPCDAIAMADEVERLREVRDQAVEVAVQRGVEIAKLQAALTRAEKEAEDLRTEGKEYAWLIERQRQAMLPADRLWQEAHNAKSYPGLAELIEWLVAERSRLVVLAAWTRGVVRPDRYIERMGFAPPNHDGFLTWFDGVVCEGHALAEKGEVKE